MIFPSNRMRIMVATKPIEFRKGHDNPAALIKNALHQNPVTDTVFVFRAKKIDRLKLLHLDSTGLVMTYKRLEEHNFIWPAVTDGLMSLSHAQFVALFSVLDWRRVRVVECGRQKWWNDCGRMTQGLSFCENGAGRSGSFRLCSMLPNFLTILQP